MALSIALPTAWSLEISPTIRARSWKTSQSLTYHRHRAYVDALCFYTFLPWFQAKYDARAQAWLSEAKQQVLWGKLMGSAMTLGTEQGGNRPAQRFVLLPTETSDLEQIDIPREWIDIPNWGADYLLMAYVDAEGTELIIYGYTTHAEVKRQGRYDSGDRTYAYPIADLHLDLNAFWEIIQCCPNAKTQGVIPPLPVLSDAQTEQLRQPLRGAELAFPHRSLSFSQWAAVLAQFHRPQCFPQPGLEMFEQSMTERPKAIAEAAVHGPPEKREGAWITATTTRLSAWFQTVGVDEYWQSIEMLWGSHRLHPITGVRKGGGVHGYPVRRAKLIQLATDNGEQIVTLLIQLSREPDARIGVLPQLYPEPGATHLPTHATLALRLATGEILQSVCANSRDNYIQLTRFRCPIKTSFQLEVSLKGVAIIESLVV